MNETVAINPSSVRAEPTRQIRHHSTMPSTASRYKDDRRLVRRMLRGDEMAFEEFSNTYIPILYRFAQRRLVRDQDLVADLVQTTLCKALPKIDTYRGESALVTWLCTCLRNEINGHYRKAGRAGHRVEIPDEDILPADVPPRPVLVEDPEISLLASERRHLVHETLDTLPPHYGKALEWKYLDDLSVREIASRLDLSPKGAESLLTRARVAFRERYLRIVDHKRLSPDTA